MVYMPGEMRWYLAQVVQEVKVEGEPNMVHISFMLVRANSYEEAYEKSVELGKDRETLYENMDGKLITVTFQGLRDLNLIPDELTHGTELLFEERLGVTRKQIEQMVVPKERLSIFLPPTRRRPTYIPKDIAAELNKYFGEEWAFEGDLPL